MDKRALMGKSLFLSDIDAALEIKNEVDPKVKGNTIDDLDIPKSELKSLWFPGSIVSYLLGKIRPEEKQSDLNQHKDWLSTVIPPLGQMRLSRRLKKIQHDLEIEKAIQLEKAGSMNRLIGTNKEAASMRGFFNAIGDGVGSLRKGIDSVVGLEARSSRAIAKVNAKSRKLYHARLRELLKGPDGHRIAKEFLERGKADELSGFFKNKQLQEIASGLAKDKTKNKLLIGTGVAGGGLLAANALGHDAVDTHNSYLRGQISDKVGTVLVGTMVHNDLTKEAAWYNFLDNISTSAQPKTSILESIQEYLKGRAAARAARKVSKSIIRSVKGPSRFERARDFMKKDIRPGVSRAVDATLGGIGTAVNKGSDAAIGLARITKPGREATIEWMKNGPIARGGRRAGKFVGNKAGDMLNNALYDRVLTGNPFTQTGKAWRRYWKANRKGRVREAVSSIDDMRRSRWGADSAADAAEDLIGRGRYTDELMGSLDEETMLAELAEQAAKSKRNAMLWGGGALGAGLMLGNTGPSQVLAENAYLRGQASGMNRYASVDNQRVVGTQLVGSMKTGSKKTKATGRSLGSGASSASSDLDRTLSNIRNGAEQSWDWASDRGSDLARHIGQSDIAQDIGNAANTAWNWASDTGQDLYGRASRSDLAQDVARIYNDFMGSDTGRSVRNNIGQGQDLLVGTGRNIAQGSSEQYSKIVADLARRFQG